MYNRLRFVGSASFMAGAFAGMGGAPVLAQTAVSMPDNGPEEEIRRPTNMIFVLVDDLRFDGMGFLQEGLKTPNIDRLASGGTYFRNAMVTSSLCSPSRATILTGMTTRNHGVVDNNNSTEAGLTFFPSYLQQAGYQTGFFGKWHMGDANDDPRPGFDRWVSFEGQGSYYPTDGMSDAQIRAGRRHQINVDGTHVDQQGYITDELTDYALDWLRSGRDADKPFFLYLSHKAVHSDAAPAERHRGQYDDVDFTLPDSAADTPENREGKPLWVQNQRNSWHGIDFPYHSDRSITDYMKRYYETLSAVDDSMGRLLSYLQEAGIEQDTMIVFYSDNGFLFGDHGLIDKRNAYAPSVKVPMVVFQPGRVAAGREVDSVVRNLDLAPTFLDVAGLRAPEQMEGTSFLPLATGSLAPEDWKPGDFVYEYYWEWSFPHTPTTFAIQRGHVKYIQYHGVWDLEELYDLERDPLERHNLIDDPAYAAQRVALRSALFAQMANREGQHVVPYTERFNTGMTLRNPEGSRAADFPKRWYAYPDPARMFEGLRPESIPAGEGDAPQDAP